MMMRRRRKPGGDPSQFQGEVDPPRATGRDGGGSSSPFTIYQVQRFASPLHRLLEGSLSYKTQEYFLTLVMINQ